MCMLQIDWVKLSCDRRHHSLAHNQYHEHITFLSIRRGEKALLLTFSISHLFFISFSRLFRASLDREIFNDAWARESPPPTSRFFSWRFEWRIFTFDFTTFILVSLAHPLSLPAGRASNTKFYFCSSFKSLLFFLRLETIVWHVIARNN